MYLSYFTRLLCCLIILTVASTGCEQIDCGCTQPPKEPVTTAAFSRVTVWYLSEVQNAGQLTRGNAIKDRYSMRFRPDGSYVQTLLSDGTEFIGLWQLTGVEGHTLQLIDHKNAQLSFTVEKVTADLLVYRHLLANGQSETYSFKSVQ